MTTTSKSIQTGEHTRAAGRQSASDALDKAGETVRELRSGARDFASRSLHGVADSAAAAQRRLGEYAGATTRYVSDQPVKSALIAAAIGALVAGVVIAARRHNRKSY